MKTAIIIFCAVMIIWLLLPLSRGVVHFGMTYSVLIFAAMLIGALRWDSISAAFSTKYGIAVKILCSLFAAGLLFIGGTFTAMLVAAHKSPPTSSAGTVIVLGCQVNGSEPSRMLYDRICAAYEYLADNPETVCVASGGQGSGEDESEGRCIFDELVGMGIDADRIFIEEKSVNTRQNLEYSAELIAQNSLPDTVIIATDSFHELRAQLYSSRCGLSAYSVPCHTWWLLSPGYWFREVPAIYKCLLGI